jgi:hypothetical protein
MKHRTYLAAAFLSCLLTRAAVAQDAAKAPAPTSDIPPNTWVDAKLKVEIPAKYRTKQWNSGDGFCDSVYRSKTGSVLIRTGIASKALSLNPGFYSNTSLEWNLSKGTVEVIDVFEGWRGGSSGGAKLLPAFKDHPSPSPRHTYDGMAYDSGEDALYLMLGANGRMRGGWGNNLATAEGKKQLALDNESLWKFTFKDRKWQRINTSIRQFWGRYEVDPYESHLEYWPDEKKLMFLSGKGHRYAEFDIATQKWAKVKLKGGTGVGVYGARSTWDSKRGLWLFRRGMKVGYIDPKTKTGAALPDLPEKYNVVPKGRKSWHLHKSIAYISKHDVYIVTAHTGNDTFVYHPDTKKWERIAGGDAKLFNGYMEYDVKTDTVVLVIHRRAFKFKYVPKK